MPSKCSFPDSELNPQCGSAAVAITPDGTRVYVTNAADTAVSVIDTGTNTMVATIPVGPFPEAVAITPAPKVPKTKEDCKHGGYLKFGPPAEPFKSQGQCTRYVEHHRHHEEKECSWPRIPTHGDDRCDATEDD
jgi:YVTN family beta-propeller protein